MQARLRLLTPVAVLAIVLVQSVPSSPSAQAQSDTALTDELRSHCRQHLAAYEVPAVIEFTTEIPRSPLGKVLKNRLRALAAQPPQQPPAEPKPTPAPGRKPRKAA